MIKTIQNNFLQNVKPHDGKFKPIDQHPSPGALSPSSAHHTPLQQTKRPTNQVSHLTARLRVKEKSVESVSRGHPLVTLGRFVYIRAQRCQAVPREERYSIADEGATLG